MSVVRILAFESSCDDTSAAVIQNDKILANVVANQKIHEAYGGVVPELASRSHQKNIIPVAQLALDQAGLAIEDIDAIGYTAGPGLLGSLLVGSSFAKAMAMSLEIPFIAVNHMRAHILAHFIKENETSQVPQFPFLNLTVSGGHTQLVLVKDYLEMEIIGQTIDDAAGEAFDKVAKMLGLDYPGGPLLDKYSQNGNAQRFQFTHPKVDGLNFSFSGLKTSVLYFLQKEMAKNPDFIKTNRNDICASVQRTIVDILLSKLKQAAEEFNIKDIGIAGGVSANSELRKRFVETGMSKGWNLFVPKFEYCTDNAAMVAITAYQRYLQKKFSKLTDVPSASLNF